MTAAAARPQHLDALDRANHVRMAQCHLKKSLAAMATPDALQLLAGMLMAPDDALDEPLGSMRLGDVLAAVRRVGPVAAERLIALSDPHPPASTKRVRELTVRQRRCVARMLERRAGDWSAAA